MTSCANSAWVNDRTASARTNRSDLVAGGPRRSPRHRPRNRAADCSLLDRYLANRSGDAKKLKSPLTGFRLRCGDYRVFFDLKDENTITITALRNRREAYR
jgi:mRNA-degrading endonuclease RelE of RelBE toxin-antitoxin system